MPGNPQKGQCCCVKSSDARDFVSQQWSGKAVGCDGDSDTSSLDAFLRQTVENTFTVSGMVFQDAYNLDLARLIDDCDILWLQSLNAVRREIDDALDFLF